MKIVIEIDEDVLNNDKTIDDMVQEMAEKGLISSSALYLMSER